MAIQGKYLYWNSDLSEVYNIRDEVICKELGVIGNTEDDKDKQAILAVVYDAEANNKAVGTGRLLYNGEEYIIDQILVRREERRKYYGDFLLRLLLTKAFTSGAKEVIAYTRKDCIQLYKNVGFIENNGCITIDRHEFTKLSIKQENICKKCNKL